MKKWTVWVNQHRRQLMVPFLCVSFLWFAWAVLHREISGISLLCAIVWFFGMTVSTINNRKNEILHYSMEVLIFSDMAVYGWNINLTVWGKFASSGMVLVAVVSLFQLIAECAVREKSGSAVELTAQNATGLDAKSNP